MNQKIDGFIYCCKRVGLTNSQGVLILQANGKDLMLRHEAIRGH